MRQIISIDVVDLNQVIAVTKDGLLWLGTLQTVSREEAKKHSVKEGDRFVKWMALNGPEDGDPPWRKKMKFWDAMEKHYGSN